MITNDSMDLVPKTSVEGRRVLEFEFEGLRVGVAEYEEGPTGCTVFHFPKGVFGAADVRGGASVTAYTRELGSGAGWINGLCWAGGSTYGLEAIGGLGAELFAMAGYSREFEELALVSGGAIYDYGARDNGVYPDKALGRAALRAAREGVFPLGACGVGRSASCGWFHYEQSGQGGAFRQIGPTKVAVFTVVNSSGVVMNRRGEIVRGNLDAESGKRFSVMEGIERELAAGQGPKAGNTALTLVVTNQKLGGDEYRPRGFMLEQLGRQVHASMARAIQPFHTVDDGDTLWVASTDEVENPELGVAALGVVASEVAWEAVLSCFG